MNTELNKELNRIATEEMKEYETDRLFDDNLWGLYRFMNDITKTPEALMNTEEKSIETMNNYLEDMETNTGKLTKAIEYLQKALETHTENTSKMRQFMNGIEEKTKDMKKKTIVEIEIVKRYNGSKVFYFNIVKQTEDAQYVFFTETWQADGVKAARSYIDAIEKRYGKIDEIKGETDFLLKATKAKYNIAA